MGKRDLTVHSGSGASAVYFLALVLVFSFTFLFEGCGHRGNQVTSGGGWSGGTGVTGGGTGATPQDPGSAHQSIGGASEKTLGDVLADIERYPAPGNVDKTTFELLREELKRQLGERGTSRFTSAVGADSGRVEALAAVGKTGGAQILWEAHLTGDTNSDGEVSVADITPIAQRYLKIANDGVEDGYDAPCDADRNDEVGITDITPIAIHYLERVDGYNVYRRDTPSGTPTLVGSTGFKTASGLSGARTASAANGTIDVHEFAKRPNVYVLTDPDGGAAPEYYEVRPVSGTDEAADGNEYKLLYDPSNLLASPNTDVGNVAGSDRDDEVGLLKDELVINFAGSATLDQMIGSIYSTGIGAHVSGMISEGNGFQLRVTTDVGLISGDRTLLAGQNGVDSVENNYLVPTPDLGSTPSFVNPEPDASLQWNLQTIHAEDAWNWGLGAGVAAGGQGTVIAFIDTGIQTANPEFTGKIDAESVYIDGKPQAPGDPDNSAYIEDEDGHGTAVAAIAAASQNGIGISGVAYAAQILVVKAGFKAADGRWFIPASSLAEGIYYAVARNATVIHISNAVTTDPGTAVHRAIEYALANNIPVVCPAGDSGGNADMVFPGSYIESLTVGATDWQNGKAVFSNFGTSVAVAAPGSLVYSANIAGGYQNYSRTTLASAQVAAAVALIRAVDPTSAPSGIRSLLRSHVTPLAPALGLGTGIIDLGATLPAVPGAKTTLAAPDPVTATPGNRQINLDWPTSVDPAVSGYFVYRDTVSGFTPGAGNELTQIIGRTLSQWNDTTVLNGRTYYYQVKAYGTGNNWSTPTAEVSGTAWPPITWLSLLPAGSGAISAAWDDAMSGEMLLTGYNVYYGTADDFSGAALASGSPFPSPAAIITGLVNGLTHYVWVTVLGEGANESGPSLSQSIVVGVPEAPLNVLATDGTVASFCLVTWDTVGGATAYRVYRADDSSGANESLLGQTGAAQLSFQDATGSLGVHYFYRVSASNGFGAGPVSPSDEGWRGLSAPSGVNATDGTHFGYVRVGWIAEPQADDYEVWRGVSSGGPYPTQIASSTGGATAFDDSTAVADVHYWYIAVSKLGADGSPASNDDEGWRQVLPPNNITASDGTHAGYTEITWSPQPEASDYEVWRGNTQGGPYSTQVASSTGGTASYNDATGTVNIHYWYVVKSKYGTDASLFSLEDEGWRQLSPPSNVTATDGAYMAFTRITWSAASEATDYEVWRGDGSGGPYLTQVASSTGGFLSFDDDTGVADTHYWYVVKSKMGADKSQFSAEDEGWRTSAMTWHFQNVDTAGDTGQWTSIALDSSNRPHISYYDVTPQDLDYAYYNGTSWQLTTVDSTGDVGLYTSIALDSNDNPHMSYVDRPNYYDKYAKYDGGSWQTETIPTVVGYERGTTSIALDANDYPHIAFSKYEGGYAKLYYAYFDGSSWQVTAPFNDINGYFSSIELDSSGLPCISSMWVAGGSQGLEYTRYTGSIWTQVSIETGAPYTGAYTSLVIDPDTDRPRISYYNTTDGDLKYAYYDGTTWQKSTVDSTDDVGGYTSLELDSFGLPHISYYDFTNHDLKYTYYDGSSWTIATVDGSANDVGKYLSLALDSADRPHISYYDETLGNLKYAWVG